MTDPQPQPDQPDSDPPAEMSDIEKLKAAHAARRSRRRPPRPPSSPSATPSDASNSSSSSSPDNTTTNDDGATPSNDSNTPSEDAETVRLREEVARLNLEMKSLHRNHIENMKAISAQRDMFAEQLAREQRESGSQQKGSSKRPSAATLAEKLTDVEAQLRAARIRNSDLESENTMLRDEVKQLNFRVQASKTLDAASNGYQQVVDELVEYKLKCAQLSEEKEDLLRINKDLSTSTTALRDANGVLEKSRTQWVLQCADVEKKRTELENTLKRRMSQDGARGKGHDVGSDLQELKL